MACKIPAIPSFRSPNSIQSKLTRSINLYGGIIVNLSRFRSLRKDVFGALVVTARIICIACHDMELLVEIGTKVKGIILACEHQLALVELFVAAFKITVCGKWVHDTMM